MNIEILRDYCLSLPKITEETPFGPDTLVFKIMGKIFAIIPLDNEDCIISLKNTPYKNQELRAEYAFIQGAFHMNKTHWNMVLINNTVKSSLVKSLISESYDLVFNSLSKKLKEEFENI